MVQNDEAFQEFKEDFQSFDLEGSGKINTNELDRFMKSLGQQQYTDAQIQEMLQEVDADGTGDVDFPELLTLLARNMKDQDTEEELMESFKCFGKDGNEGITVEQLHHIMINLGDKLTKTEIAELIREADIDNNGVIDKEEFVKMMMTK